MPFCCSAFTSKVLGSSWENADPSDNEPPKAAAILCAFHSPLGWSPLLGIAPCTVCAKQCSLYYPCAELGFETFLHRAVVLVVGSQVFDFRFSSIGRSARGGFLLWSSSAGLERWASVGTAVLCRYVSPPSMDLWGDHLSPGMGVPGASYFL